MNRFMTQLVLVAVVGLCFAGSARAAIQYYDVVPTTAAIDGGAANWEDSNWKSSAGATSGTTWTDTNFADFEPIVGSPSSTAITINSTPNAGQLIFNGAGYTIGGGSITITDRIQANQSATINSDINYAQNMYLFAVSGQTLTLGGHITDTNVGSGIGNFNVEGEGGMVVVNGTGTVISPQLITVASFGALPGNLSINSGDVTFSTVGLHQLHVGVHSDGGSGIVNWNSTGTLSNISTLYLGDGGTTGTFTQTAGTVSLADAQAGNFGDIRFDDSGGSNDSYNINGGVLEMHDGVQTNGGGGQLNFGGGTLEATGAFTLPSSLTHAIASGATAKINTNGFDVTIGGVISGASAAGLTKTGTHTLTLSGHNTYAGLTDIEGGALTLSGSAIGTVTGGLHVASGATFNPGAAYTVGSGNTLSGGGTVNGSVDASGATISPGDPASMTIIGGLTLDPSSVLDFEFASNPVGGDYDQIHLTTAGTRDLILDGTLDVTNLGGLDFGTYTLISGATSITDSGLNIVFPVGFNGNITTGGGDVFLNITQTPEPASLGMLVLGGGMLLARRHTRKA